MIQCHQPQVRVQLTRLLHNPLCIFDLPRLHQLHRQRHPKLCKVWKLVDGELLEDSEATGPFWVPHRFDKCNVVHCVASPVSDPRTSL